MKRKMRRLLSLLMVLVLVCSMIPASMAISASAVDWSGNDYGSFCWAGIFDSSSGTTHTPVRASRYDEVGYTAYMCDDCGAIGYVEDDDYYYDDEYYEEKVDGHTHRYTYYSSTHHYVECMDEKTCEYWEPQKERHDGAYCVCMGYSNFDGEGLYIEQSESEVTYSYLNEEVELSVEAYMYDEYGDEVDCTFTFEWDGIVANSDDHDGNEAWAELDTSDDTAEAYCVVTAYSGNKEVASDIVYWEGTLGADIEVEATIFNTNTGYALGEVDDEGNTSIEEQIYDAVSELAPHNDDYELEYVTFDDVDVTGGYLSADDDDEYWYNYDLGEVIFYPDEDYVGKATFDFTAWYTDDDNDDDYVTGTITFDVKEGGSGLGIVYTALVGEDVELDEADFVEFWEEAYPNGTLDYVKFNSISSSKGKLYDADDKQIATSTKCYYYPTRNSDVALEGLTFEPKSSTAGAVELGFKAYGSTKRNGSTSTSNPLSGTITILYTANEVTPIEYLSTGSVITLDADDFIAKYKEVMGAKTATANSLSIQFLEAPAYGSLYLNYKAGSYYNGGTELTDKNILNYTFSGNKNASRSIEDVTYVPGTYSAVGESLTFACYYGSALKFVGTVNFGATDPIAVEYTTSGTTPVTFSSYDFANAALTSGYLYFGTPSKGTLYRNYANGTGTRVNTYDTFTTSTVSYGSTYSLNTLTYVPPANYVGVVEIPIYSTYSLMSTQVKGTVKIYVGRSFTDMTGANAWAIPYVNKLSAQGIVNGTDAAMTKFSPTKTVTYGEALKLIMMAAGYPEQAKTNTHWASGYLTKAYYDGLVSSSAIDLNAEVTRDTIASITAKALGLSYASSVNYGVTAPSDSTNGYVYALYNAGIVNGVYVGAYNYWYGSRSITRAEISKIICMVADYDK